MAGVDHQPLKVRLVDELVEQGFEVMVVSDATAAAQLPGLDGYAAALANFRMIASHVADTDTTVAAIRAAAVH